jgi:hypothetical protein
MALRFALVTTIAKLRSMLNFSFQCAAPAIDLRISGYWPPESRRTVFLTGDGFFFQ